jgi:putative transposase
MNKSFKVRVYPTEEQKILLEKTFGANRFVYNYFLNLKSKLYEFYELNLSFANSSKVLTELKKQKTWLKEVDAVSLQQTLRDLDSAYRNFFSGKSKYPKFKRKDDKNSYRANMNLSLNIENHTIKIPKVGSIRFRDKNDFGNVTKIYNITISKTTSGKYYASISAEVNIKHFEKTNQNVGIDLGLKDFAIFSSGEKIIEY